MTETVQTQPKPKPSAKGEPLAAPANTPAATNPSIVDAAKKGWQEGYHPDTAAPDTTGGSVGADAKKAAGTIADTASSALHTVGEKGKSFFGDIDIGKILGGLFGLAGAWFLGNFFGSGVISTILTICLAFPLMVIGSDKIGGMINGWMGHGKSDPSAGISPQVTGPQAARDLSKETPVAVLSNDALNSMLDDMHHRVRLMMDTNHHMAFVKMADTEVTTTEQIPHVFDETRIGDIEKMTPGSTGIGVYGDVQNKLLIAGLPPRPQSSNQR